MGLWYGRDDCGEARRTIEEQLWGYCGDCGPPSDLGWRRIARRLGVSVRAEPEVVDSIEEREERSSSSSSYIDPYGVGGLKKQEM
jgi:hypothetical protein